MTYYHEACFSCSYPNTRTFVVLPVLSIGMVEHATISAWLDSLFSRQTSLN